MDLLSILTTKIERLEPGDHTPGLAAVLLHIETAIGHLARGQDSGDDTAFTDAIYRANQAFEGSIKEAYRVIAGNDPERKRPFEVEDYLQVNKVLRDRVLAQFSNYRREWRNPSAHDYKLDFDESEAFLAIVAVAGFACVLLDQIAEKLSFAQSKAAADAQSDKLKVRLAKETGESLARRLVELLRVFSRLPSRGSGATNLPGTEIQLVGAITGFLSATGPDLATNVDAQVGPTGRPDIVVSDGTEKVIIEVKRTGHGRGRVRATGLTQLEHYLRESGAGDGILYLAGKGEVDVEELPIGADRRVFIVQAVSSPDKP